jgi:lipopolysaccharide transport system ATP-binding protein
MSSVIKAEGLTKIYSIAHQAGGERSLRADLERFLRGLVGVKSAANSGAAAPAAATTHEDFRALDDVSFEVRQGDRLGIIGRNGAGKSTLLKILSRVVEPTRGRIELRGRISSLLEVGTGFHPELTGRENILLNGAVLGMSRRETARKMDEIIAFAEVEKFVDTPVKFYSSGMYVRLAFSVSAHLDPDVLILDEVLAVGDVKFQQKCMEKMRVIGSEGRTLLFVSHSAQSITQLCQTALWLDHGRVARMGESSEVVQAYLAADDDAPPVEGGEEGTGRVDLAMQHAQYRGKKRDGDERVRLLEARILDAQGNVCGRLDRQEPFRLQMRFEVLDAGADSFVPNFHLYSVDGSLLTVTSPPGQVVKGIRAGMTTVECQVPGGLLNQGVFRVHLAISSNLAVKPVIHVYVADALTLHLEDDMRDVDARNGYMKAIPGLIRPRLDWSRA